MKKNLKWRLSKLPTAQELGELVDKEIITKEEAKQILVSEEDSRDEKSLKDEIVFLRKLVDKLSEKETIIKTIEKVREPYYDKYWYRPYEIYCGDSSQPSFTPGTGKIAVGGSIDLSCISNF